MSKKAFGCASRTACFSSMSSTLTARIGPSGGVSSPKRLMSALLNGRSHAKALPLTNHVRLPKRAPTVTSGSSIAIRAASSGVAGIAAERSALGSGPLQGPQHHRCVLGHRDPARLLGGDGEAREARRRVAERQHTGPGAKDTRGDLLAVGQRPQLIGTVARQGGEVVGDQEAGAVG